MNTSYLREQPIWLVVGPDPEHPGEMLRVILAGRYGSGGTFTLRREYSGEVVGRAGGYGYDKQGTALAVALSRLYGMTSIDGARGERSVVEHASTEGIRVVTLGEALFSLAPAEVVTA